MSLLLSAVFLTSPACRAVEEGGAELHVPSADPAVLEAEACRLRDEGLAAEAGDTFMRAALLRDESDPLRLSDARSAALLLSEPSPLCAEILLGAPDSLDALLAVRAGGASAAPRIMSMLSGGGIRIMPGYTALLLAESLASAGMGREALQALSYATDSFPKTVMDDLLLTRYRALLCAGALGEATAIRAGVPQSDSVLRSRMLNALGWYRHSGGIDGWEGAFSESIRLWPSGYIHGPAWRLLRTSILADSSFASSLADAFYSGGLWNELYDVAVSAERPPAHLVYLAARTRDRLGYYREACVLLDRYLNRWPSGPDAENALMYLGLDLARSGLPDSGLAVLDRWEAAFPASTRRGNIPWYRGSILAESNRWAEAIPHFRRMQSEFPSNVATDDAAFYLCIALLETGRAAEARDGLAAFVSRYGRSVYAQYAGYMLGRLLLDGMNDPAGYDTLRAVSRLGSESIPAVLAQIRLGASPPSPGISTEPLESWMRRNGIEPAPPSPASNRALVLLDAGLRRWAMAEFRAAETLAGGGGRLALTYIEHDVWERMPNAGWRLSTVAPEPWPMELWRLRYPAAWPELVLETSGSFGFDPVLVWSIMRQESMFQPWAASPAGARGLIQMIPSTSETVALEQGWDGYSPDALFEPAVSLRYGICYLSGIASEMNGPLKLLASYNGGPHNAVGRWGASSLPDDLFFGRITFNETRLYVEKVYANYAVYRQLYPEYAVLAQPRFTRTLTLSPPGDWID